MSAGRALVNVRAWPGRRGWRAPRAPTTPERLGDRLTLVLVAVPEREALPERLGLAGWRLVLGERVVDAGVVHADELEARGPRALVELHGWAHEHETRFASTARRAWKVETLSDFARARRPRGLLYRAAYAGRGLVAGADLGRTFGLLTTWWRPARRRGFADGFTLGLPGWGEVVDRDGRPVWNPDVGAPMLHAAALGVRGVRLAFGSPRGWKGFRRGRWDRDERGRWRPYPGRFVDLVAAAFALDGVDSDALGDHLPTWGIEVVEPRAVGPDAEGADHVAQLLDAQHHLVLALDAEAARWRVELTGLQSPATVASQLLTRMGVAAPLGELRLGKRELEAWTRTLHGGWVT